MIVVGLTGSVGMGKSTTAAMFAEAGVPVFDADATVHALYQGHAVAAVEAAFPGVSVDGVIDRVRLGDRVMHDGFALKQLESIVHPLVHAERQTFLAKSRADGAPIVVLDIPLLFETGADDTVDAIVLVSAPLPVQKARVMSRPGMSEARFEDIVARQMPDAEKRRRSRFIIETGDGFASAARQVRAVIATLEAEDGRA